jgi:hypothetical protein
MHAGSLKSLLSQISPPHRNKHEAKSSLTEPGGTTKEARTEIIRPCNELLGQDYAVSFTTRFYKVGLVSGNKCHFSGSAM